MFAMVKTQLASQIEASHGEFIEYVADDEEKQEEIRKALVAFLILW